MIISAILGSAIIFIAVVNYTYSINKIKDESPSRKFLEKQRADSQLKE